MTTQTTEPTKSCPVCGVAQERGASGCNCCGWDFSPLLGAPEQVEALLRERLDQARTDWRQRRYNPDLIPELERDPFETPEEFASRLAERPWYVGEVELQKAGYDMDSGLFPLHLISRQRWADPWLKPSVVLSLTLPRDQAKALYQQGANWPLYAHLIVRSGQTTLDSLVLVSPDKELQVVSGGAQQAGNATLPTSITSDLGLINDRYRDLGNGTILDIRTGLQWMRCALGQSWDGQICHGEGEKLKLKWDDLRKQVHIFNRNGGFAGHTDWRVPSKQELATLILKNSTPAIDQQAFPNAIVWWYWTSESEAYGSNSAWCVYFGDGCIGKGNKGSGSYVRLVRSVLISGYDKPAKPYMPAIWWY